MSSETYFRVGPRFWMDTHGWSEDARLLALYILTCPHRRTEGIFRLPIPYILADLDWSKERFGKPFAELLAKGFIDYDEGPGIVLIRSALKWQAPENPNQVKAAVRAISELPANRLVEPFIELSERFSERLAKGLREGLPEGFGKPPTPTPTTSPTTEVPNGTVERGALDRVFRREAKEDFALWQELTGHPRTIFDKTRERCYVARRKEGHDREKCQAAIRGAATPDAVAKDGTVHDEWRTVFRNTPNLEMYVGFAEKRAQTSNSDFVKRLNSRRAKEEAA